MISPRVNYQPLWPELVLPKKRHFYVAPRYTRHSLWVFSLFFSPPHFFFFSPLLFSRGGLTDGRSKRRGRSPLAWRGLQPSTALLATGQSLCQVSTYRPTWIFSGLRRNDKPSLLFLRFSLTSSRRETPSSGYLHLS